MTGFEAAALYVGLGVLLLMLLKMNVGRVRTGEKIAFGDGANERLQRSMRVQGNAIEDVPITLLGIMALAMLNAPVILIHVLGATLIVARILHAVGLSQSAGTTFGRLVGTLGSVLVMLVTAGSVIWFSIDRFF